MTTIINDPNPVQMPTSLPFVKGQTNKTLLRAAWRAAGLEPSYPVEDTREVFALLRAMGYQIDRRKMDYHHSRYVERPHRVKGNFHWTEADIVRLADSLESVKSWLPLHPCHRHKLTGDLLAKHQIAAASLGAACRAFSEMEEGELITLMAGCNSEDTRILIASVLKRKLGILNERGSDEVPATDPAETN